MNEAVAFGDYFFVEALQKALRYVKRSHKPHRPIPVDTTPYPEDSLPESARTWTDGPTEENLPPPE